MLDGWPRGSSRCDDIQWLKAVPGMETSRPPLADASVSHVPPQSETTDPENRSSRLRILLREWSSAQACVWLTWLYEHMIVPVPARTASANAHCVMSNTSVAESVKEVMDDVPGTIRA